MSIDAGTAAIIGAAVGGLITLIGNWISLRHQKKLAEKAHLNTIRENQKNYLAQQYRELMNANGIIEGIFAKFDNDEALRQDLIAKEVYGKAIGHAEAACLAVTDEELGNIKQKMTPYLTNDHRDVNRKALEAALIRMTQIIEASYNDELMHHK